MSIAKRRIMLVHIMPKKKGTRTYATISSSTKNGNITLSGGNLTCTYADAVGVWGTCFSDTPIMSGVRYWETTHDISVASSDTTPGLTIDPSTYGTSGQIGASASANKKSMGGPDKNGDYRVNGILTVNDASPPTTFTVGHLYDADQGIYKTTLDGSTFTDVTAGNYIAPGVPYYPAVSMYKNSTCEFNFGASDFVFGIPENAQPGVYSDSTDTDTVYLSSERYITTAADDPASVVYLARISSDSDVIVEREGSCWVRGNQTRGSRGELRVITSDRELDAWADYTWRDARYEIYKGYQGDARSAFTLWSSGVVENDAFDENVLVLTLTDKLSELDRAANTDLFDLDTQNTQIQFKPKPVCMGRPWFIEGALLSTVEVGGEQWKYQIANSPIASISSIYDRGDVFDYPIDWEYLTNRLGFQLKNKPIGKIVCNPIGELLKISPILDVGGIGEFTSWGSGALNPDPTGWTVVTEAGSNQVRQDVAGQCTLDAATSIYMTTGSLTAGKMYSVQLDVADLGGTLLVGCLSAFQTVLQTGEKQVFTFTAPTNTPFRIQQFSGSSRIDNVYVYEVRVVEYLEDWIRYLLVGKAGLSEDDIDWDSVTALAGKANYRLADYLNQSVTYKTLLRDLMDCWCGWAHTNLEGKITFGRFEPPSRANAVLTLQKSHAVTPPVRNRDKAASLTTRMQGAKNWTPHADTDLVTTVTPELKAQIQAEYLFTKAANPASYVPDVGADQNLVSAQFAAAIAADPKPTLLQEENHIQSEISRVASNWRNTASDWEITVVLEETDAGTLEPGDDIILQYPEFGLDDGVPMKVLRVRESFFSNQVSLTLWDPEIDNG